MAIRAFQLLENEFVVPKTTQCSLILTRLPRFAQLKLKEWYCDQLIAFRHNTLLYFASRVDDVYKETRKESSPLPSILKVNVHRSRSIIRDYVDSPSRKRFRSSSPTVVKSPRSFPLTRNQSPVPYTSQNHYKGVCAKCGKEGHSIARCRHATVEEKNASSKS